MTRSELLQAAHKIINGERDEQYGSPENNFATIAALWPGKEKNYEKLHYI